MKRLIICTVLIVAAIEVGGAAVDSLIETANAEVQAFAEKVEAQRSY